MAALTIRHGWRTRAREALAGCFTLIAGVLAATADAPVVVRIAAALAFLAGVYALLDALVLAASWRLTADRLKVPTLLSRRREIEGEHLTVTPGGRLVAQLVIAGPRGARRVAVNPLVSPADVRAWFNEIGV